MPSTTHLSRRRFLSAAAGAALLGGYSPAPASALGANDRINFALIGGGMRGGNHLPWLKRLEKDPEANIRLAAVCEIHDRRKEFLKTKAELPKCHHNYEDILADPEIHAVIIATPDHWHRKMSLDAMAAGKAVYCEKPMTLHWEEAKDVLEAQRASKSVFAVGAQSASKDLWRQGRKFVGDGKTGLLGKLLHFQTSYNRNVANGDWNYAMSDDCTPQTLDWTRWLGPAPKRDFDAERFFRFRKFWDYSGGLATDLMYHQLAHMSSALGFPFPKRVGAVGGNYIHFDREVPDTMTILAEMEPGFQGRVFATSGNEENIEETIRGEHGSVVFGKGGPIFYPQAPFMDAVREKAREIEGAEIVEASQGGKTVIPEIRLKPADDGDETLLHLKNFIHSIRTGAPPTLGAEEGARVMATIALGVKSYRENRFCQFDPATLAAS